MKKSIGKRSCAACRQRAEDQKLQTWVTLGKTQHLIDKKKGRTKTHQQKTVCGVTVP